MKAARIHQHGGPEALVCEEIPEPKIKPHQVLVRVRACALNHLDLFVRAGIPGMKFPLPHILGSDIAGEVVAVGDLCERVKPGWRVVLSPGQSCRQCEQCLLGNDNFCRRFTMFGYAVDGGNVELLAAPEYSAIQIPDDLPFETAAAAPLVFLTAWHMLVGRAALKPGETVLVLAAGSGVGIAAVQIAKMLGATVIATASTDAKLARARELGADEAINYVTADFAAETRRITGKRGVDVVIEHTGQATWEKSVAALARGGRLVTCGATSGFDGKTDLRALFGKSIALYGSYMGRLAEFDEVLRHIRARRLKPVIDRVLPLAQARAAHEAMENREQFGKIVLAIGD